MRRIILLFALLIAYQNGGAQFFVPSKNQANEFKGKTLIVIEDGYLIDEKVVELIKKTWPFKNKIIVEKRRKLENILFRNNKKSVILQFDYNAEIIPIKATYTSKIISRTPAVSLLLYYPKGQGKAIFVNRSKHWGEYNQFISKFLFKLSIPNETAAVQSLEYWQIAMTQMKDILSEAKQKGKPWIVGRYPTIDLTKMKNRQEKLRKDTLLIPKEMTNLTDKELKEKYDFNIKVLKQHEIMSMINSNNGKGYAYCRTIWSDKHLSFRNFILDGESKEVLAQCGNVEGGRKIRWIAPNGQDTFKYDLVIKVEDIITLNETLKN